MSVPTSAGQFAELVQHLKDSHGLDFSGYRETSLRRRIERRMAAVSIDSFGAYLDYLQVHPAEYASLFDSILINVTSFFRDRDAWDHLAHDVLPALLAAKEPNAPIRAWSVGCASGQEAFSLCMLLAQALTPEDFHDRVKIYATDLDDGGLSYARQAHYLPREMKGVPEDLIERFFELGQTGYTFRGEYRRAVVFGRHDVVQDAPISRLDLLLCRNTLMYFNRELQNRVLSQFRFALNDEGVLFLGRAEMLLSHSDLFVPLNLKHRVFRKAPGSPPRQQDRVSLEEPWGPSAESEEQQASLRHAMLDSSPATIAVNARGDMVIANEAARQLLGVTEGDVGRPLRDLEISYRPVDLRSMIDEVREKQRPVTLLGPPWPGDSGVASHFDVSATPLLDERGRYLGASIQFIDVTDARGLHDDAERVRQELTAANIELQTMREELATTTEELQCTIEELETTNEELQSTNEELETMNEELQSTNEELETMNEELRDRSTQVAHTKSFLESILASVDVGVIVVGLDGRVLIWNQYATELWGLRADEVAGRDLRSLDFGLPMERLEEHFRAVQAPDSPGRQAVVRATNRRGRAISCRITFSAMRMVSDGVRGVILLMAETAEQGSDVTNKREPVGQH